jgi:hypothetical protein
MILDVKYTPELIVVDPDAPEPELSDEQKLARELKEQERRNYAQRKLNMCDFDETDMMVNKKFKDVPIMSVDENGVPFTKPKETKENTPETSTTTETPATSTSAKEASREEVLAQNYAEGPNDITPDSAIDDDGVSLPLAGEPEDDNDNPELYEKYESEMPPRETLYKWRRFHNVFYETLRKELHANFNVEPDIEDAVIVYGEFENQAEASDFLREHEKELICDVHSNRPGGWAFIGPFSCNRSRVHLLGKNVEMMEAILETQRKNNIIGKNMTTEVSKKLKTEELLKFGPEAKLLETYKKDIVGITGRCDPAMTKEEKQEVLRKRDELIKKKDEIEDKMYDAITPDDATRLRVLEIKGEEVIPHELFVKAEDPSETVARLNDTRTKTDPNYRNVQL